MKITNNYESFFQLNCAHLQLKFQIPSKKNSQLSLGLEDCNSFLRNFAYEEVLLLYLSLLLEKTIIFVSKSKQKISEAMNTLLSLIKPFNWVYPIIYFLPEDC